MVKHFFLITVVRLKEIEHLNKPLKIFIFFSLFYKYDKSIKLSIYHVLSMRNKTYNQRSIFLQPY